VIVAVAVAEAVAEIMNLKIELTKLSTKKLINH